MTICTAQLIYFSPTHTTQRILTGIAQGIDVGDVIHLDLTPPGMQGRTFEVGEETISLLGAPVYGGRLPKVAVERLYRVRGNDTPAVLVVVYGNRAFEDALLELKDITSCGRRRGCTKITARARSQRCFWEEYRTTEVKDASKSNISCRI